MSDMTPTMGGTCGSTGGCSGGAKRRMSKRRMSKRSMRKSRMVKKPVSGGFSFKKMYDSSKKGVSSFGQRISKGISSMFNRTKKAKK